MYANLTISLAQVLDARFFRVWGAIYAVLTLLLWIVVFARTVVRVPYGRIFDAPCLLLEEEAEAIVSSQTTRTEQEQDRAGTPMVRVQVGDDLIRQEKMRAEIC